MKSTILFCAGLVTGALAVTLFVSRYSVQSTSTGPGIGYVVRLDRWTGRVASDVLLPHQAFQTHFGPPKFDPTKPFEKVRGGYEVLDLQPVKEDEWSKLGKEAPKELSDAQVFGTEDAK